MPPLTWKDLPPPAEAIVQLPSEEALELPHAEERRGTAKQWRQTQTVADVETSAETQLYAVPTGEGYFPNQSVFQMLASIHAAIARSAAGTSGQDPAHHTAHPSRCPTLDPDTMHEAAARTKKRQRVKEDERVYERVKTFNTCRSCGQPKLKETGHRGFKGYSFCPKSGGTYEAFLAEVRKKIDAKKSK